MLLHSGNYYSLFKYYFSYVHRTLFTSDQNQIYHTQSEKVRKTLNHQPPNFVFYDVSPVLRNTRAGMTSLSLTNQKSRCLVRCEIRDNTHGIVLPIVLLSKGFRVEHTYSLRNRLFVLAQNV